MVTFFREGVSTLDTMSQYADPGFSLRKFWWGGTGLPPHSGTSVGGYNFRRILWGGTGGVLPIFSPFMGGGYSHDDRHDTYMLATPLEMYENSIWSTCESIIKVRWPFKIESGMQQKLDMRT